MKNPKQLKVTRFPQKDKYVPSVRIAGEWLRTYGFEEEDRVTVVAEEHKITISKIRAY